MDKNKYFQFRASPDDRKAIAALAEKLRVKKSEAVRQAVYIVLSSKTQDREQ